MSNRDKTKRGDNDRRLNPEEQRQHEEDNPEVYGDPAGFGGGARYWYVIEFMGGVVRYCEIDLDPDEMAEAVAAGAAVQAFRTVTPVVIPAGDNKLGVAYAHLKDAHPAWDVLLRGEDHPLLIGTAAITMFGEIDEMHDSWGIVSRDFLKDTNIILPNRLQIHSPDNGETPATTE